MKMMFNVSFSDSHATAELSSLPPHAVADYNRDFGTGVYPANMASTLYFNRLYSKNKHTGLGTKLMDNVVNFLDKHDFSVILEVNCYHAFDTSVIPEVDSYHSFDTESLIRFYERFGFVVKFLSVSGNSVLMVRQQDFSNTEEVAPF